MLKILALSALLLAPSAGATPRPQTPPPAGPRLLTKPEPEYPDEATAENIEGEVVVEVEVDRKGKVTKAQALGGPKPLQKAAVKAARKARFAPAAGGGQPAAGRARLTYTFNLLGAARLPSCEGPIYKAGELAHKAVITHKPEPGFTEKARNNNRVGKVVLRAVLCRTGEVTDVVVVRDVGDGLTVLSIRSALRVRFRPAMKDGQPVSQHVTLEYNFNIY